MISRSRRRDLFRDAHRHAGGVQVIGTAKEDPMTDQPFARRIRDVVAAWEGVTVTPHRFGGVVFRVHHREIGHLHGDAMADLPFPMRMRRDLVAAGHAHPHRTLPGSGWVSYPIRSEHDVPAVIALLRLNYDRMRGAAARSLRSPALGDSLQLLRDRSTDDLPA
jgi:hypothetical protein